ncbi:MAG: PIN domain-containing protein [Acidobacteriota bacterium]
MATRKPRGRRVPDSEDGPGAAAEKRSRPDPAYRYLESSAVLAALLERDAGARRAIRARGTRVASALTFAEGARAILRARAAERLTPSEARAARRALDTLERRCAVIAVSEAVLARVGQPSPVEPVRTLDAVHLATAELLGARPRLLVVVTRDARIRDNAAAFGYRTA